MIDLEREKPVTVREAPRVIPAVNSLPGMEARKPIHWRTVFRWATRGKKGVVLETVSIGGILVTSREAIQRFFARLSDARDQRFSAQQRDNSGRRQVRRRHKDVLSAKQQLASRHGI